MRPHGWQPTEDDLGVRSFVLDERLHEPYSLRVSIGGEVAIEPEALLGARVELEITRGEATRVVHGVVLEHDRLGPGEGEPGVRLHVGPALALLGLYRRSRIFQDRSVPEIVRAVAEPLLVEQGSALVLDRLVRSYAPRDYCVQYRETDLAFVLRILAEAGITLLFDHGGPAEAVVLVDANEGLPPAGCEPLGVGPSAAGSVLPVARGGAGGLPVESVRPLRQRSRLGRRRWSVAAWDWKHAAPRLMQCEVGHDQAEPLGGWWESDEGRPDEGESTDGSIDDPTLARLHLAQRRDVAETAELHAASDATVLRAGSVFALEGEPPAGGEAAWVVRRVRHFGEAIHAPGEPAVVEYCNELEAQPLRHPVVPPRPVRPRVDGVQTAIVTGPPDEVVHTDGFGRIRVRLPWDDAANDGEHTSCWVRVAMPWAGDELGVVCLPRVGSEVVLSFVDGDPDRPLCLGGVFNGGAQPPYDLPGDKTRTVIRTRSTDGEGYNELSFQDAAGAEEVYLHAQRNLREHVRGEHSTYVGGSARAVVTGPRSMMVAEDDVLAVTGDQQHTVGGDLVQSVKGALRLRVGEAPKAAASDRGMTITVEHGTFEVDAADAIVLRCGNSRIELGREQIVLTSPRIHVESSAPTEAHANAITLHSDGIDVDATELRQEVGGAQLTADSAIVLDIGPTATTAVLALSPKGILANATGRFDAKASTVCVQASTSLGLGGREVAIDSEHTVDITTRSPVDFVAVERLRRN